MSPILETLSLRKVYDATNAPVVAVDGVSVSIETGEFVAITGPSGCGKSSLLHLLGGLDRPTSGEIRLHGARVDGLTEAEWARRRRAHVGFVFQFFNLIPNLSVADNVELPALIMGVQLREARRRRETLLAELGISGKADFLPSRLSGGQQQKVAIARALINNPDILLADEPTGNLDSSAAQDVLGIFRERNGLGQTIVMVTHDPGVAAAASRGLQMLDGRVVKDTPQRGTVTGASHPASSGAGGIARRPAPG